VYDEMESVTNEETGKRFYKTPVGNLPSMTTILGILDDGGIDAWIERVGVEESERIKTEASTRGNSLHDLNEMYLRNELDRSELRGKGKVLFNRVKPLLDTIEVVHGCEVALYNDVDGYAGRVDAIVRMNKKLTIVDHKNSRKPINTKTSLGRKKSFRYAMQIHGYARAFYYMFGEKYKAEKGCIIVGNHNTSNSEKINFNVYDDFYVKEFDILIAAFKGECSINESVYFRL
jgi:hypothetical protein